MIARITLSRAKALVLALALISALLLLFVASSRGDGVTTFAVNTLDDSPLVEGCEPSEPCMLREALVGIERGEE